MSKSAASRKVAPNDNAPIDAVGAQHVRLLEALLFAADEPLDEPTLAQKLPDDADVKPLLKHLSQVYANRGVNLVQVAKGWAFRTAPDLAKQLSVHRAVRRRLSRAALETLAIIAYHEPITRAEIEDVRGVGLSRGTLDLLLEAGWIKPQGRRRAPGRPVTWVTTHDFLNHFGLDTLQDLPGVDELRAAGLLQSDLSQLPGNQELLSGDDDEDTPESEDADDDVDAPRFARAGDDDGSVEYEDEDAVEDELDRVAVHADDRGVEREPHELISSDDAKRLPDED